MPLPAHDPGRRSYPDGSMVRRNTTTKGSSVGHWYALHASGNPVLCEDCPRVRYFPTADEATAALERAGEGPACGRS